MQAPQRFWSTTWLVVALSLTNSACNLSGLGKLIYDPEQAALEEDLKKKRAEIAETEDGSCQTAEQCKYRCEISERALDCYKTGKAALRGREVHYAGGWRVDKVSGSTDDINVHYQEGIVSLFWHDDRETLRQRGRCVLSEGLRSEGRGVLQEARSC
ncbi:hypothetical protein [Polyangium sp. 6x1]|uniref:hypothetical protein n=1 Tax=Polyangium sp. 6x1 TaxID=3042689 RepID=UPI00248257F5|nr:hypothetical protein [Polyangium sp. 6x1]MDI1450918.1 hypothetical protein [Polyangium sp. 6x1]